MIKEAGIYNDVRADTPFFMRSTANRGQITQAYAALDTNRAVGVQGDSRVYGYICVLRAVNFTKTKR
ncbi:GMP synthase (glutamine-hydrolyzing) [Orbilia oligospora]|nr:GMP synthase (glutamine-hydrolyzing) [Orbilia oligospora]